MSPEPFDSRATAPPAKRWEKGYVDENGPSTYHVHTYTHIYFIYLHTVKSSVKKLIKTMFYKIAVWEPDWQLL